MEGTLVHSTHSGRCLLPALLLLLAACSDKGDAEDGAASTSGPPTTTVGSPRECSVQLDCVPDCTEWRCGVVDSSFDVIACPRDYCLSDVDCDPDQRCLLESARGGEGGATPICVTPVSSCSEDDGKCICGGASICSGYCIPR